jgi:hypothetical protein
MPLTVEISKLTYIVVRTYLFLKIFYKLDIYIYSSGWNRVGESILEGVGQGRRYYPDICLV